MTKPILTFALLLILSIANLANGAVSRVMVQSPSGSLYPSSTTVDELTYLNGVTSNVQTQIDSKPTLGAVTATEFSYLDGVTSAIQTQLNLLAPKASPTFTGTVVLPSGQSLIAPVLTGAATATGSLTGDGGDALSGFLKARVLATATTITAAQCGSTFYNGGAIEIELPEASTVLGCELTFITANAANFDIDPDAADQILVQTDAAGDMVRNATLGNVIKIQAISASEWAPVSVVGTWADAN